MEQTLLGLFEAQGAERKEQRDDSPVRHAPGALREANPFAKRFGECAAGCANESAPGDAPVRVFWCHVCKKRFCWTCFLAHKDD